MLFRSVNPRQKLLCQLPRDGKKTMCRPIGVDSSFKLRTKMPKRFRLGWIGRALPDKRVDDFCRVCGKATRHIEGFQAVLLGDRVTQFGKKLRDTKVDAKIIKKSDVGYAAFPGIYASLDAVVITSLSEAGPLVLFEALKCGVPVISTPVGWCGDLISNGENGWIESSPADMALRLREIADDRVAWWDKSAKIAATVEGMDLDAWLDETLEFAREVARQGKGTEGKA